MKPDAVRLVEAVRDRQLFTGQDFYGLAFLHAVAWQIVNERKIEAQAAALLDARRRVR